MQRRFLFRFCSVAFTVILGFLSVNAGDYGYGKSVLPAKGVYEEDPFNYIIHANNPIAPVTTWAFEDYFLADFDGISVDANQFLIRYNEPLTIGGHDWLFRSGLPINHFPDPLGGHETGLGDLVTGLTYLFDTGNPDVSFGFGPSMRFPTATDASILGTEKWSAGVTASYFNGANEDLQFGFEAGWMQSFAGDTGRNYYHVGAFKPFAFYQLGDGWYTGTAPMLVYNFQNDDYNVPIGLRLGKVVECENKVVNMFVEPQISLSNRGAMPDWQIFSGVRFQFW